jgi:hypothetical protein
VKGVAAWLANYRRAGQWNSAVASANRLRHEADAQYVSGHREAAARLYLQAADAIASAPASSGDIAGDPSSGKRLTAIEYRDAQARELQILAWGAERGVLDR